MGYGNSSGLPGGAKDSLYLVFFSLERRVNIVDTLVLSLGEAVGTEEADTLFTKPSVSCVKQE